MNKLSIERLSDFERDPSNNFLTRSEMMEAVKELIALREAQKGEQVPVSMDALRDTVAEMSGGLPMEWKEGNDKGHHAVPFINFNSLHRIVNKFTAPQKPVVLPGISELIDACDCAPAVRDVHVWDLAISEVRRLNPSLFSEKSSAAGIVKDGE